MPDKSNFLIIAGPCQPEGVEHAIKIATLCARAAKKYGFRYVFKTSFLKANRTSFSSAVGPGIEEWRDIVLHIKDTVKCEITTDVHECWQIDKIADIADVIQIPALLSKQTPLIEAAAATGKAINIKKGQFMSPIEAINATEKAMHSGSREVYLTDRGSCFGRGDLINDFAASAEIIRNGCNLIYDATHSAQKPGALGISSGGDRRFIPSLTRAALSVGITGIFCEVHQSPEVALSDSECQIAPSEFDSLIDMSAAFISKTASLSNEWANIDRQFYGKSALTLPS